MIRQPLAMKRSFLLMIAAVAIAFAGVGSDVGWQVNAQVAEICNNGIDDNGDGKTDCVLILGTTVTGTPSPEQVEAAALGFEVHVDNATAWAARSTASFASYRAIILGDPKNPEGTNCSTTPANLAPAEANRTTWTPAVAGNVVVIGTDPVSFPHSGDTALAGKKLTANGIKFAAGPLPAVGTTGKTGAYITLSCYYSSAASGTPVPVLDQFGSFTVIGGSSEDAHITDTTHPVVTDPNVLTDADLNHWGNSIHESFQTMPAPFFEVAESLASGLSYIIARAPVVTPVVTSGPKTFSPNQTTGTFVRFPGEGVYAKLTFLGQVLTQFDVEVVFVTVNKAVENTRLRAPIFSATETCIPSNLAIDGGGCIRYTFRKVGGGVPQQGVDFLGNFRVELAFHADETTIGSFDIAHAITGDTNGDSIQGDLVQTPIDFYDEKLAATLSMSSCNCVGVGETDGFSDFLPITEPVSSPPGITPFYTGPLSPIRADGTSVIKAGRALPVKFSLTNGPGGPVIPDAIAVLGIKRLPVVASEDTLAAYEEILVDVRGSATSNAFTFTGDIYQLVVDTKGWQPGLYKATITFKKNAATGNGPYLGPQLFGFAVKQ